MNQPSSNFFHLLPGLLAVLAVIVLPARAAATPVAEQMNSTLYIMDKVVYDDIATLPDVDGGAIERFDDGFLVATGDGQFYQLEWSKPDDHLVFTKLPLASPLAGRDAFYAKGDKAGLQFRVTDLLIRPLGKGYEVFAAHQVWDREGDCFRMGLSRARLPAAAEASLVPPDNTWTTVYQTQPCIAQPFDTVETGGRLAWFDSGKILMTVGDHGHDGLHFTPMSQEPDVDYGKVLLIDSNGGAEVFTSGHRNPQGLLIDKSGQPWVTEHGPSGGDELNLLVAGNNYGWPLVTYGTEYLKYSWPLNPDAKNHGEFTEPVYAFVPSVAITALLQLGGKQFPRYEGDFLAGSLRMKTLYRFRLRDNRVTYVQPILFDKEIRDLAEAPDGRVLVWSDDETVTVLSRHVGAVSGEDIFVQCRSCHAPNGNAVASAPNLEGVFGRKIAFRTDFNYSPALRNIEGAWTEDKLLQFLANPQAFAPGTAMGNNAVTDDADRAALVEYLKTYGVTRPVN